MINEDFKKHVEKGLGCVVILAGSGSDEPHITELTNAFDKYQIPLEVRIVSAHKQSDKLLKIIKEYDSLNNPLIYITIAGGTDALSGIVSFISHRPTISCPPDNPNYSCLTNPSGSSNAYIAKPDNVARFVAQTFAYLNSSYRDIIRKEIKKQERPRSCKFKITKKK